MYSSCGFIIECITCNALKTNIKSAFYIKIRINNAIEINILNNFSSDIRIRIFGQDMLVIDKFTIICMYRRARESVNRYHYQHTLSCLFRNL